MGEPKAGAVPAEDHLERMQVLIKELQELFDACAEGSDRNGYIAALRDYAWWKGGIQYVGGSTGKTLTQAIKEAAE